jgi:hypothetical protein
MNCGILVCVCVCACVCVCVLVCVCRCKSIPGKNTCFNSPARGGGGEFYILEEFCLQDTFKIPLR